MLSFKVQGYIKTMYGVIFDIYVYIHLQFLV